METFDRHCKVATPVGIAALLMGVVILVLRLVSAASSISYGTELYLILGGRCYWIPTVPGKAWFPFFRFYGPDKPLFEKTWKLPDIEKVK
jgi:hypothetical protein